jgi:hypothetical protein
MGMEFIPSTQLYFLFIFILFFTFIYIYFIFNQSYFYNLMLLKLLYVSVIRPSSSRNVFARTHSTDNGSVVFRIYLTLWISCQSSKS